MFLTLQPTGQSDLCSAWKRCEHLSVDSNELQPVSMRVVFVARGAKAKDTHVRVSGEFKRAANVKSMKCLKSAACTVPVKS